MSTFIVQHHTVDFTKFAGRMFVCLLLNLGIHLSDHLFRASPPFRSFRFLTKYLRLFLNQLSLQQFDLVLQLLLVGQFIPALITR